MRGFEQKADVSSNRGVANTSVSQGIVALSAKRLRSRNLVIQVITRDRQHPDSRSAPSGYAQKKYDDDQDD